MWQYPCLFCWLTSSMFPVGSARLSQTSAQQGPDRWKRRRVPCIVSTSSTGSPWPDPPRGLRRRWCRSPPYGWRGSLWHLRTSRAWKPVDPPVHRPRPARSTPPQIVWRRRRRWAGPGWAQAASATYSPCMWSAGTARRAPTGYRCVHPLIRLCGLCTIFRSNKTIKRRNGFSPNFYTFEGDEKWSVPYQLVWV